MSSLSIVVPTVDRARVRGKARRLYAATDIAATGIAATGVATTGITVGDIAATGIDPGLDARLRRRVCQQVAAIAPQLSIRRLSLLARYALWCYQLDDRLDQPGADLAALSGLCDQIVMVASGAGSSPGHDPLPAGLSGLLVELSSYDLDGAATERFRAAVADAVMADLHHVRLARAVAAGSCRPPSMEEYLGVAARTVNYVSFACALLALAAGPLGRAHLAAVEPALCLAARAVRLGNDLRGAVRPAAGLNVVTLACGNGVAMTRRQIRAEIGRLARDHDRRLRARVAAGEVPQRAARALIRCLAQSIRLYRHTDLR